MLFTKDIRTDQELLCHDCDASHLLIVEWSHLGITVAYNRFCGRMSYNSYDDPLDVPILRLRGSHSHSDVEEPFHEDETMRGPIIVRKRKSYFSKADISAIWLRSNRQCHLCKRKWKLSGRSRYGWHIDHVVPNFGGGHTEVLKNFLVACAKCNLRKGGTVRNRLVQEALFAQIIRRLEGVTSN